MTTLTTTKVERSPHPLSEIFPRMNAEELDRLAEDIKANGLKEAIWLFEDKILDGNNRYGAGLKIAYRFSKQCERTEHVFCTLP
jgi:ParB-like chromosome segregation protein Spo0J